MVELELNSIQRWSAASRLLTPSMKLWIIMDGSKPTNARMQPIKPIQEIQNVLLARTYVVVASVRAASALLLLLRHRSPPR